MHSPQKANAALQNGWKLLALTAVSNTDATPGLSLLVTCYELGKRKPADQSPDLKLS